MDALNSSSRSFSPPRLLDLVRGKTCPELYAMRTGRAYVDWVTSSSQFKIWANCLKKRSLNPRLI
jgi:hypothetical protein